MSKAAVTQLDWPAGWPSEEGLYEMALGIARRRDPAMDLCSDAKLRGLQEAAKGKVLNKGWFRRVMKNAWIDSGRSKLPLTQLPVASSRSYEVHVSEAATPEEQVMRMEAAEQLLLSVQKMAPRQREILALRYFKGETIHATAKKLGISTATVEREHKVALERMGKLMEGERGTFGAGVGVLASAARLQTAKAPEVAGTAFTSNSMGLAVFVICLAAITAMVATLMNRGGSSPDDLHGASPIVSDDGVADAAPASEPSLPRQMADEGKRAEASAVGEGSGNESAANIGATPESAPRGAGDVTASAAASRTFSVRLTVDGRGPEGWIAREPLLESDGHDLSGAQAPRCLEYSQKSEDGLFTFTLPEAAGSWAFTFEDRATWTTIWLVDPGRGEATREIQFDTGSAQMMSPGATAVGHTTADAVLVGNPEPGIWVVSSCKGPDEKTGAWLFERVLASSVSLKAINGARYPDDWKAVAGPWTVPSGDVLRLP